ncbi:MAG: helix-hairpin-helix domain-containing protein [Gammaproteobacteria bacterium]|jgi:competence protein ComEA
MNFSLPQITAQKQASFPRRLPFFLILVGALGCIALTAGANADTSVATKAQIYLASTTGGGSANQTSTSAVASAIPGTVDLNTASAEELAAALKGVGLSKAKAIVRYRTEIGPFRDVRELEEVKGIGPRTVAQNKSRITLSKANR